MDWSPIYIDATVIGLALLAAGTYGVIRLVRHQRQKPVSSYWRAAQVREHAQRAAAPPSEQ